MAVLSLSHDKIHKGNLILVNAEFSFFADDTVQLMSVGVQKPDITIQHVAATALSHILKDISCGDEIVPVSGHRTKKDQGQIYSDSLQESGEEFTKKYVALPDHSEHQTGLAIDLGLNKPVIDFVRPDFPDVGACGKFQKLAPKYGFVQRYPLGKEQITGIAHEPWHFRFVGYPHSEIIAGRGLCLEEYIEMIKSYPHDKEHLKITRDNQEIEIFYLPCPIQNATELSLPDNCIYQISGNNFDGFIITLWRQANE